MSNKKRRLRTSATILFAACVITVLVAWGCATWVDVGQATPHSAEAMTGEFIWSAQRWDRPGATYVVSQSLRDWAWSPSQALGKPDTPGSGDQVTAWASLTAATQREWLCLEYADAVVPKSVRIHETYHPGAVDRVTVFSADGKEIDAWKGVDPTSTLAPRGVSEIPLNINFPIRKLTIHLNSLAVPGWNEIDAVALVSTDGREQWARRVIASSSYGAPAVSAADLEAVKALLPWWGGVERGGRSPASDGAPLEVRAIDGRGWPFPAMWCERDGATGSATAGALGHVYKKPAAMPPGPSSAPSLSLADSDVQVSSPPTNTVTPPPLITYGSASGKVSPSFALRAALPIRIAWPGFLFDVAFYALILAVLRWLLVHPARLAAEVSRMRNGRCIECGYDLVYDFRAGCPECGWRRKESGNAAQKPPELSSTE